MSSTVTGWPEPLVYDETEDLAGGYGRAVFNAARTHRYLLERRWRPGDLLTWTMLNPSKAGAFIGDPTVGRCVCFARRDGFAGIRILNLHALQATDPSELRRHPEPVGLCNDLFIAEYARGTVIAAWGAHEFAAGRAAQVSARLAARGVHLVCLGVTAAGHPKHPLARGRSRVPDDAPFVPWGHVNG